MGARRPFPESSALQAYDLDNISFSTTRVGGAAHAGEGLGEGAAAAVTISRGWCLLPSHLSSNSIPPPHPPTAGPFTKTRGLTNLQHPTHPPTHPQHLYTVLPLSSVSVGKSCPRNFIPAAVRRSLPAPPNPISTAVCPPSPNLSVSRLRPHPPPKPAQMAHLHLGRCMDGKTERACGRRQRTRHQHYSSRG